MKKQTFTAEEKAEYRKAQRDEAAEMMKKATAELLTSEGWRRWATLRSRLHNYSPTNTLLILIQRPDASMVASFNFWKKETERTIIKGERSLKVFAPLLRWPTAEDIEAGHPADRKVLYGYKLVPVFDVSQTEGEPLPTVEPAPLEGDEHAALLPKLEALATKLGFSVTYEDTGAAGGWCNHATKQIVVDERRSPNAQVAVLVHEIAHALGVGYKEYGRQAAEVIVETVTFIVCNGVGLDTSSVSVPYVAGWGEAEGVKAIDKFAALVSSLAKQIEEVLA